MSGVQGKYGDPVKRYDPPSSSSSPVYTEENLPEYEEEKGKKIAIAALVLLFIFLGVAIALYYIVGDGGRSVNVSSVVSTGGDSINAEFKTLEVEETTILGSNSSDRLRINSSVSTNIIPDGNNTRNLGGSNNHWDKLYVDDINFSKGVDMTSDNDNLVRINGGFGSRKYIELLSVSGVSSGTGKRTLVPSESGYTFVLNEDTSSTYSYKLELPTATGSGVYYDFITGTSVGSTTDSLYFDTDTANNNYFTGSIRVTSDNQTINGPGDSTDTAVFSANTGSLYPSDRIRIDQGYPVPVSQGNPGILKGSQIRFTDYANNIWQVDGTMIVDSGISSGDMINPFYY